MPCGRSSTARVNPARTARLGAYRDRRNGHFPHGAASRCPGALVLFQDYINLEPRSDIIPAPALTVVSRPEEAEVHLRFYLDDEDNYAVIVPARGRVGVSSVRRGSGTVVRLVGGQRVRVLWGHKDSQRTPLERRPSANFGREFVKLYRRYN
jgi:hypothetical protein